MARARNIKPGFFKNADLVELPIEARLLFVGLWTLADRAGRLEDRPKQIKMELFPADAVDVDTCLDGLQQWGFVVRYEIAGKRLLQVVNFDKHQNPHRDEKVSALPAPDGSLDVPPEKHGASTVQAQCKVGSDTVPIGLIPDSLIPDSRNLTAEPLTGQPARKRAIPAPDDVDAQVWADWLQLRKEKRATVTATVIEGARRESVKAGMTFEAFLRVWCRRGTQGLEAEWLKPHERAGPGRQPTAAEARAMQAAPSIAAPHLRPPAQPIQFVEEVRHEPTLILG